MNSSPKPKTVIALKVQEKTACCSSCAEAVTPSLPSSSEALPENVLLARYRIEKLCCATEERLIRNRVDGMHGIVRLDFNLLERELTVVHRLGDPQTITAALDSLDMGSRLLEVDNRATPHAPVLNLRQRVLLAISGLGAVGAETAAWLSGQETSPIVLALAAISLLSAGLPTLKKGWIAITNLTLNIHFLMSLAVVGALAIGKWPEAAMVVFLFALAEAIEALSLERARHAIKSLTALAPETAEVKVGSAGRIGHRRALRSAAASACAPVRVSRSTPSSSPVVPR